MAFNKKPGCCCGGHAEPCGPCNIPDVLHVTDSYQTTTLTYSATLVAWVGCYMMPVSAVVNPCACSAAGPVGAPAGNVLIVYTVSFIGGVGCSWQVLRDWYFCEANPSLAGQPCGAYCVDQQTSCAIVPTACGGIVGSITCLGAGPGWLGGQCQDSASGAFGCSFPLSTSLALCQFIGGLLCVPLPSPLTAPITIDI